MECDGLSGRIQTGELRHASLHKIEPVLVVVVVRLARLHEAGKGHGVEVGLNALQHDMVHEDDEICLSSLWILSRIQDSFRGAAGFGHDAPMTGGAHEFVPRQKVDDVAAVVAVVLVRRVRAIFDVGELALATLLLLHRDRGNATMQGI